MSARLDLWPVAIIEDRYNGSYSKGRWLAIAEADAEHMHLGNRVGFCIDNGPYGGDVEAGEFWASPPAWIAAGNTPDEALAALRAKHTQGAHPATT